jgi:hypothetical protein
MAQATSGSKYATFDGMVLEVFGMNGSTDSKRMAIPNIEKVACVPAKGEWMFMVKTRRGGFGMAVSDGDEAQWQALAQSVSDAIAAHQ